MHSIEKAVAKAIARRRERAEPPLLLTVAEANAGSRSTPSPSPNPGHARPELAGRARFEPGLPPFQPGDFAERLRSQLREAISVDEALEATPPAVESPAAPGDRDTAELDPAPEGTADPVDDPSIEEPTAQDSQVAATPAIDEAPQSAGPVLDDDPGSDPDLPAETDDEGADEGAIGATDAAFAEAIEPDPITVSDEVAAAPEEDAAPTSILSNVQPAASGPADAFAALMGGSASASRVGFGVADRDAEDAPRERRRPRAAEADGGTSLRSWFNPERSDSEAGADERAAKGD
ncbi:MAG: hypothetical protein AAF515_23080 [Pseudomonadota bacterium]